MSRTYVIIVAAGTGSRFGSDIPKQFLPLGSEGLPVLMHTVEAFRRSGVEDTELRVIISPVMTGYWAELCAKYNFISPPVVPGGETRYHSVKNALASVESAPDDLILIHDGVRPLVDSGLIRHVQEALETYDAVIPAVPVTDSLRRIEVDGTSQSADRSQYVSVQTPQGFRADVIKKAYRHDYRPGFTDDASVAEYDGNSITVVEGNPVNIKITQARDLEIAGVLMRKADE